MATPARITASAPALGRMKASRKTIDPTVNDSRTFDRRIRETMEIGTPCPLTALK